MQKDARTGGACGGEAITRVLHVADRPDTPIAITLCDWYLLTDCEEDCRTIATYPLLVNLDPYLFCR